MLSSLQGVRLVPLLTFFTHQHQCFVPTSVLHRQWDEWPGSGRRAMIEEAEEHHPKCSFKSQFKLYPSYWPQFWLRDPFQQLNFHHICDSACKIWDTKIFFFPKTVLKKERRGREKERSLLSSAFLRQNCWSYLRCYKQLKFFPRTKVVG